MMLRVTSALIIKIHGLILLENSIIHFWQLEAEKVFDALNHFLFVKRIMNAIYYLFKMCYENYIQPM